MSLLYLPDELVLRIVEDALVKTPYIVPVRAYGFLTMSRRLYHISQPLLYAMPEIRGHERIENFCATIRERQDLAAMVDTLEVDFTTNWNEEHVRWTPEQASSLELPVLPRCTELHIQPTDSWVPDSDSTDGVEAPPISLCLPMKQIFGWVARCPQLKMLHIASLQAFTRPPLTIPSSIFDAITIVPPSLTEFVLSDFTLSEAETFALWRMCFPWVKKLQLQILPGYTPLRGSHLNGIDALSDCLQDFTLISSDSVQYIDGPMLHEEIPIKMPFLTSLSYPLPEECSFNSMYPNLRTLEAILPSDAQLPIQALADAVAQGRVFPRLRKLMIYGVRSGPPKGPTSTVMIIRDQLAKSCADRGIKFMSQRSSPFAEC